MRLALFALAGVALAQSYFPSETITTSGLALSGTWKLDGAVYAQPQAVGDCLIVATMGGSLYCLDRLHPGVVTWRTHLADPRTSGTGGTFYGQPLGCLSRPAIDATAGRIYAVCTSATAHTIYTVNMSGTVLGSTVVAASVPGTGCGGTDPVVSGQLQFAATEQFQRAALTLNGSTLLVGFSWGDGGPGHGWLLAYDVSGTAPALAHTWNSTPTGCGGAIWQSAGPVLTDGSFYYVATGNGTFDGSANLSMSVVKLDLSLNAVGHWTPASEGTLNAVDADVGSGAPLLVGSGLLSIGFKDWRVHLLDTATMLPLQDLATVASPTITGDTGIYGGVFADGFAYFPTKPGNLYAFPVAGTFGMPAVSPDSYAGTMAQAVTGTGAGKLVWIVSTYTDPYDSDPWKQVGGTLRALDPGMLSEVWSADIGRVASFSAPTFKDGRVYVGNADGLVRVFSHDAPILAPTGNSISLLDWRVH